MNCVLTIGNFDGLHIGHRRLISSAISLARGCGARAVAMTFTPHPRQYFHPTPHFFLHPEVVKQRILDSLGLDEVVSLPFADIHDLTPLDFFENTVLSLHPVAIVLGANFHFGRGNSGDIDVLRGLCAMHDIEVHSLPMEFWRGEPVSSTRIRAAIQQGRVADAAAMLGAPYALYGRVEHGASRGHTLGFATANIHAPDQVMPAPGVYASRIAIDSGRALDAVTAVTHTPTFGAVPELVETHILDYDGDIYDRPICVQFLDFLRDERRFASADELVAQLRLDCEHARTALASL